MERSIKTHGAFLLVLSLAAVLFLVHTGAFKQFLRAESNFSLGARAMLESGEWLTPHAPHEPPLRKPPLQYWLIGMSYAVFGTDYGSSRIPSALIGLGVMVLVYGLGLRLGGPRVGVAASAMLATSYMFWNFARLSMPDMLLTFCVFAALVCWTMVLTDEGTPPSRWAYLGSGAVALGFLAKGPIALALTVPPLLIEVCLTREFQRLRQLRLVSGTLIVLGVSAGYLFLVYLTVGIDALYHFVIQENLQRFTGAAYNSSKPMLFYEMTAFLTGFAPWSPLLLIVAAAGFHFGSADTRRRRILRLLLLWMVWPLVFFSLASFKLDYYLLPSIPPAALLVAYGLVQGGDVSKWTRRAWITTAVVTAILLPIGIILAVRIAEAHFPDIPLRWLPFAIGGLAILPVLTYAIRRQPWHAVLAFAFALWAGALSAYLLYLPSYGRLQPVTELAAHVPADAAVYASWKAEEWALDLAFSLPSSQPVEALSVDTGNGRLTQILDADARAVAFVYGEDYAMLASHGKPRRILAQAEAYRGNRFALKSLLHPRRDTLYLVGR